MATLSRTVSHRGRRILRAALVVALSCGTVIPAAPPTASADVATSDVATSDDAGEETNAVAGGETTAGAAAGAVGPIAAPDWQPRVKAHLRAGAYDDAIELLTEQLTAARDDPPALERAYLLLINTYVLLANSFRSRGDFVTAELYAARARQETLTCLEHPALHHARPEPAAEFPPEMIGLFRQVRSEILGGFRVIDLQPADAVVRLDGDIMGAAADGDSLPGAADLPIGSHVVEIVAEGFTPVREEIQISPGATLERAYQLERGKGPLWYVTRGAVAAGVATAVALLTRSDESQPEPEVLPGPPPPP